MSTESEIDERAAIQGALQKLVDLAGPDFMTEMVALLKQQTPEQFHTIDEALATNDLSAAQRQAHSMKSSFGTYGAKECQRLATAADFAAKQGHHEDFKTYYTRLREAYDRLVPVLDEMAPQ